MRISKNFLFVLLLASPAGFCGEPPEQVVKQFYRWAIRPAPAEIGRGLAPVQQLLGKELYAALEAQQQYETACAAIAPANIKPYSIDQSPFFVSPDKAKALHSTEAFITGNKALVGAKLVYDELAWTDTVVLRRSQGMWVIQEIQWQEGGSLIERLARFASSRCAK